MTLKWKRWARSGSVTGETVAECVSSVTRVDIHAVTRRVVPNSSPSPDKRLFARSISHAAVPRRHQQPENVSAERERPICRSSLKPIFVTPALRSRSRSAASGSTLRSCSSVFWNVRSPRHSRPPPRFPHAPLHFRSAQRSHALVVSDVMRFCGGDSLRRGAISSVCTFTLPLPLTSLTHMMFLSTYFSK